MDLRQFSPFPVNGSGLPIESFGDDPQMLGPGTRDELGVSDSEVSRASKPQKATSLDLGPYARFPNKLFGSGMARELGASPVVLYMCLCEYANRNGSNSFKARDRVLADETGLGERTIRNARNKLEEKRLITCSRPSLGTQFEYTILPQELEWVPVAKRPRKKKNPRALAAVSSIRGP